MDEFTENEQAAAARLLADERYADAIHVVAKLQLALSIARANNVDDPARASAALKRAREHQRAVLEAMERLR